MTDEKIEIEITQEMIEAGVFALRGEPSLVVPVVEEGLDLQQIVHSVLFAVLERQAS